MVSYLKFQTLCSSYYRNKVVYMVTTLLFWHKMTLLKSKMYLAKPKIVLFHIELANFFYTISDKKLFVLQIKLYSGFAFITQYFVKQLLNLFFFLIVCSANISEINFMLYSWSSSKNHSTFLPSSKSEIDCWECFLIGKTNGTFHN